MTDWTVIVTTLGASGITGTVGYLSARRQAETAARAVESENDRLRAQHAEDHLRNRQTTYHQLLDILRRFDVAMWSGPGFRESDFQAFMTDFGHLINGGLLFGTDEVRTAAIDLDELVTKIEFHVGIGSASFDEALREALDALGDQIAAAKRRLIEAMRADVAPTATVVVPSDAHTA